LALGCQQLAGRWYYLQRLKTILAVHEKGMVSKNRKYIEVIKHNKKTSSDASFNYCLKPLVYLESVLVFPSFAGIS